MTKEKNMVCIVCTVGCRMPVRCTGDTHEVSGSVLAQIAQLRLQAPVAIGQVLIEDVAGTGVPVVATRTITRAKP